MSGKDSGVRSAEPPKTDWERLRRLSDADIRRGIAADPDTFELYEAAFARARLRLPDGRVVERIPIDAEISDWLRADPERRGRLVNDWVRRLMWEGAE
jgi:hypothetical protein